VSHSPPHFSYRSRETLSALLSVHPVLSRDVGGLAQAVLSLSSYETHNLRIPQFPFQYWEIFVVFSTDKNTFLKPLNQLLQ